MGFRKGQSGNPSGRRKGSRNQWTLLREQLSDDIEEVIEAVKTAALSGSEPHARLLLQRVLPAWKPLDPPISMTLRGTPSDRAEAIIKATAAGRLSPDQAGRLMALLAEKAKLDEITRLEERIAEVEKQLLPTHRPRESTVAAGPETRSN